MSEPVTKKLSEILAEKPHLRVWGIRRRDAHCETIWNLLPYKDFKLTWYGAAWSCRPFIGTYQQIIIFVPEDDTQ